MGIYKTGLFDFYAILCNYIEVFKKEVKFYNYYLTNFSSDIFIHGLCSKIYINYLFD